MKWNLRISCLHGLRARGHHADFMIQGFQIQFVRHKCLVVYKCFFPFVNMFGYVNNSSQIDMLGIRVLSELSSFPRFLLDTCCLNVWSCRLIWVFLIVAIKILRMKKFSRSVNPNMSMCRIYKCEPIQ